MTRQFSPVSALNGWLSRLRASPMPQENGQGPQPEENKVLEAAALTVLDTYVTSADARRNAIDIFRGEWSTDGLGLDLGGIIPLFDDSRIWWGIDAIGGVEGKRVLELGPLEAGHTYMLEHSGAAEVVAIEANTRAFLKCLIVKELIGLTRARFLCADFIPWLEDNPDERFDACIASGVLYHMLSPVQLLSLISRASDRMVIWTHYYSDEYAASSEQAQARFSGSTTETVDGFEHTLYRQEYTTALQNKAFTGGNSDHSNWLTRETILQALAHFGFSSVSIEFEEPEHPWGPCFTVAATRDRAGAPPWPVENGMRSP